MGLRDPQHERFALLVGSGQEPEPAWLEVYERKPVRKEAAELAADPDVAHRIREVQDRAMELIVKGTVCSGIYLLNKLRQAIDGAAEDRKWATVIAGVKLAAAQVHIKLFPSEHRVHHTTDRFEGMNEAEILAFAESVGLRKPPKAIEGTATRVEEGDADGQRPLN